MTTTMKTHPLPPPRLSGPWPPDDPRVEEDGEGGHLTPMVDVAFILIIFFAMQRVIADADSVRLPLVRHDDEAAVCLQKPSDHTCTFTIRRDGTLLAAGEPLSAPARDKALAACKARGQQVVLLSDAAAPVQAFMDFWTAYSRHGFSEELVCLTRNKGAEAGQAAVPPPSPDPGEEGS